MEVLSSPLWTPLGVVVTFIVGFGGIYLTLWYRSRKALSFDVKSNERLVTVQQNHMDSIEISYHGTPVNDVRMIVIRIWNSGNVPILVQDYIKPIYIPLGGKLLTATVIETTPPELNPDVLDKASSGSDHSGIQLYPLLLNPRDSVSIQAILADSDGSIDVYARIAGIPKIQRYDESRRAVTHRVIELVISCSLFAFATTITIVVLVFHRHPTLTPSSLLVDFALPIGLGAMTAIRAVLVWGALESARIADIAVKRRLLNTTTKRTGDMTR